MGPEDLFTREEALGGLPARRAATLLFLVESRAAYLADQSRRAADFLAPEEISRERDLAFLEAWSVGREPPVKPTIQDLERHAAQWATLVPANPTLRAAVAHLLGRKYPFTKSAVPGIRAALGLDDEAVKRAYRRQYGVELDTLYAAQARLVDWLPWAWARLSARVDALSPFWLTFALTIAFGFSQALLALPTGVARVGALPGAALVVAIGLINMLTMACMSEACARSGDFRYGRAFVGRLVTNFLGPEASTVFSAITAMRTFLVLLAGSLGIGLTLATFTGVRAEIWVIVLLIAEVYYLSRKSASVTIATMLSLITLNLLCVLLIALLAATRLRPPNLLQMHVPFLFGEPLDPGPLRLVFGVVVALYIGHVYLIQCAKIVLPRDPSARALIKGSIAASIVLTTIFVLWILVVNGAVDATRLARESGTVLTPLAERIGPAVHVLGSVLVVLLLGMSCLRTSTVLFNLAQERIPTRLRSVVRLPRRRASLLFGPRGAARRGPHLGVTYLGLAEGHAHLRIEAAWEGAVERLDVVIAESWDASSLLSRFPAKPAPGVSLVLEVVDARPEAVSLRFTTTMSAAFAGEWSGAGMRGGDQLTLDDSRRGLVNWMTRRREVSFEEIVAHCGGNADEAGAVLGELTAAGLVEPPVGPTGRYRVHLAARRARRLPPDIWKALEVPTAPAAAERSRARGRRTLRAKGLIFSEHGRFALAAAPVVLVSLMAEWLLLTHTASFAGVLGFTGVIANSLTAGIFPVLLLFASRRKGDYVPGVVYRVLGHPAFTAGVCLLALANLVLHALFIYRDPWSRGTAAVFALLVIVLMAAMLRRGMLGRRSVVELREDMREGATGVLAITSAGRPLTASIRLRYAAAEETVESALVSCPALSTLRSVALRLPAGSARELKIWTHRVTADGVSEPLPAFVEIRDADETNRFDLKLSGGQALVPVRGADCWIEIEFPEAEPHAESTARAHDHPGIGATTKPSRSGHERR